MVASVLIVAGLLFVCGCIGVHDDSDSDDSVRGEGGDRVTCCAAHSFAIDESGVNWFAFCCHNCAVDLAGRRGEYVPESNAVPVMTMSALVLAVVVSAVVLFVVVSAVGSAVLFAVVSAVVFAVMFAFTLLLMLSVVRSRCN